MEIFLVMVNPTCGPRYVDTAWVSNESAVQRQNDLITSLKASGSKLSEGSLWVWIAKCRLQDGVLTPLEQEKS